jgi:hypothetical protein
VAGFYEHGNEPSVSTKGGEFIVRVTISFSTRTMPHGVS